ncbi:MAG TPA: protein-export chaperone SecB [Pseudomonas xinjiangensis]|uniref:Protein-export protein SecB n=2 Tax=root TaxID=1 RepID=A0A7V1BM03_9GAMM|nr:protein-export chaperone SecB [Halopseudomonas xinjiangensis]HEC48402.1 protein-export chaperone SecB [Halopseudomonas xinjiangensis]
MADENQNNQAANGAAQNSQAPVQFSLQRIYVKDLSFESPKAPAVFQSQWSPQVNLDLNTRHTQLQEGVHEVVLSLSATVTNGEDEVTFIAEVQQAGIFAINGLDDAAMRHTLGAFCPNILFPYAREAIDNLVLRGSFPPLMLSPVNFDALYAQAEQRRTEEAAGTA